MRHTVTDNLQSFNPDVPTLEQIGRPGRGIHKLHVAESDVRATYEPNKKGAVSPAFTLERCRGCDLLPLPVDFPTARDTDVLSINSREHRKPNLCAETVFEGVNVAIVRGVRTTNQHRSVI